MFGKSLSCVISSALVLILAASGCRNEPDDIRPVGAAGGSAQSPGTAPPASSPAALGGREEGGAQAQHEAARPQGAESAEPGVQDEAPTDEPDAQSGDGVAAGGQGVTWRAPAHWPQAGGQTEFRVATYTLPARSMGGAGECVVYRFPGGGDPQANVQRWLMQFADSEGERGGTEAQQAERSVNGVSAWLVRTRGTYITQDPPMQGPEVELENHALFGAVLVGPGDPVFLKCTGPQELIESEAAAIRGFIDSMRISP